MITYRKIICTEILGNGIQQVKEKAYDVTEQQCKSKFNGLKKHTCIKMLRITITKAVATNELGLILRYIILSIYHTYTHPHARTHKIARCANVKLK